METIEARNEKFETGTKPENSKRTRFDLENRALIFARVIRHFVAQLPKNTASVEDGKQLVRSSGSIGANYLEANESLSKKDFLMRVKIAKKEARETIWWLEIIDADHVLAGQRQQLLKEATELMNILGAIARSAS